MPSHIPPALLRAVEAAGWTISMTSKGHYRFTPPAGFRAPSGELARPLYFTGSSQSDFRAVIKTASKLRREGVDVPRSIR